MGFTDSNDGADEVWVLMIVLVRRGDFFSVFIRGLQYVHYCVSNGDTVCFEVYRGV